MCWPRVELRDALHGRPHTGQRSQAELPGLGRPLLTVVHPSSQWFTPSPRQVPAASPLGSLSGSDNLVELYTQVRMPPSPWVLMPPSP